MFRVVNDNIYMAKGETPTYELRLIYSDGSPFRLPVDAAIPHIDVVFAVSSSPYMDRDVQFRYRFGMDDWHRFADPALVPNPGETTWSMPPAEGNEYALHFRELVVDGETTVDYQYYDYAGTAWIPYEAILAFPFVYEDTNRLAVKTYWYDINIFYYNEDNVVAYKEQLMRPHWFTIEGSMSYGI